MSADVTPVRVNATQRGRGLRTTEHPMAFTAWEFIRGALLAWLFFVLLAPLAVTIGMTNPASITATFAYLPMILIIAPLYAVPWSAGALLALGVPLALVLGLLLRGVASVRLHLICFAALGAFVGGVTTVVQLWSRTIPQPGVTYYGDQPSVWDLLPGSVPLLVSMQLITAIGVTLGWWITARRALRA